MPTSTIPHSVPLIAYAEHFLRGARVLLRAKNAAPLVEALLQRGALHVHVFESDPVLRAEAEARFGGANVVFGAPDYGLHETFDVALIEDLNLDRNAQTTTRGIARLLGPQGVALFGSPNPEANPSLFWPAPGAERSLDYYGIYDAVAAAFPSVRMLGQVPFVGCALVDFSAEDEPSPVFDTSLLPARGEEPEFFVALGSREKKAIEGYVVVQLPSSAVSRATSPSSGSMSPPQKSLAARLEEKMVDLKLVDELTQKLSRQEAWIAELEARSAAADERADNVDAELDELRERHANLEQTRVRERLSLTEELEQSRAEVERLRRCVNDFSDQLELEQSKTKALATSNAQLTSELAELNQDLSAGEIAQLENQLKEQGQRVRGLERELREAERIGRELLRKLGAEREKKQASPPSGLAERLVEAEAELTSLRWSLQMLGQSSRSDVAAS